jgi:hypothetical protein
MNRNHKKIEHYSTHRNDAAVAGDVADKLAETYEEGGTVTKVIVVLVGLVLFILFLAMSLMAPARHF